MTVDHERPFSIHIVVSNRMPLVEMTILCCDARIDGEKNSNTPSRNANSTIVANEA